MALFKSLCWNRSIALQPGVGDMMENDSLRLWGGGRYIFYDLPRCWGGAKGGLRFAKGWGGRLDSRFLCVYLIIHRYAADSRSAPIVGGTKHYCNTLGVWEGGGTPLGCVPKTPTCLIMFPTCSGLR